MKDAFLVLITLNEMWIYDIDITRSVCLIMILGDLLFETLNIAA